ncbi:Gfo/Idh/MocA family oxidoreductase [Mesorhizobium sp. BR1-1-16]|uniref:Gfo/Idh/MocA family protein n=1 Tax=Mesorhizobium sp. BR1-1-16 TaxID=2876653 RepID=UPI001CCC740A|nr:Gfo/Idh/MocA family oxidoreductase [Mesorhizobium sp. BR1-1-16]MBZ9935855.1 Gfo/Idh/MocA family oxidoreductase [Mesorhizobium sp. BR1-1-16]
MQRAALIGCGAMSRAWFEAAKTIDGLEIVGVADIDAERAASRAAEFGLENAVIATSVEELLEKASPEILFDVVVPGARHHVVSAALAAGCHVLSEKPMANSLDEARDLVARAKAADRLHVVIQNRRYLEGPRRIRRAVASGLIGDVTSVHCDFFLGPHFGGFREEMEHVLLLDMAIHTFDAARFLSGKQPEGVYCREWEPKSSWYKQGSSAAAIFEFGDGLIFNYRGSWCAEGLGTSWESAWRIVGTKGSLTWDGHDDIRAEVATGVSAGLFSEVAAVEIPPLDPSDRTGGHLGLIQDFVAATRGGPEPETVGHQNIRSLAMVFGAIESATGGRRVDINI